ncbi:hypothetical protein B0H10DRAFT_1962251 [Mycena sp. CBHHK59/15]|nr:hypothetical protein B0H10DRAFT_1962251 [Mycena sp. CBHHK59/15]
MSHQTIYYGWGPVSKKHPTAELEMWLCNYSTAAPLMHANGDLLETKSGCETGATNNYDWVNLSHSEYFANEQRELRVRAKFVTSLLRLNSCAKICKVVQMLRRPLISDGVEEQALLREVEDGSPKCAVAKSLRRDGVSGRNAVRCDAQKLLIQARHRRPLYPHVQCQVSAPRAAFARGRASRKPWNTKTTAYRRSGLVMLNKKMPRLFLHDSG